MMLYKISFQGGKRVEKKIISILVACLIILTIPVQAGSLGQLKNDLKNNAQTKKEIIKAIDVNKASAKELKSEIKKLDQDISVVEEEISSIQNNIDETQNILDSVINGLEKAMIEKNEQKTILDERLRVMYMYSDTSYLDILFSSTSFSDLISKIDTIKTIAKYDQKVLEELEIIENKISQKKEQIENKKSDLLVLKNKSQTKKNRLNDIKVNRGSYMSKLTKDIRKLEAELKLEEEESNTIQKQINSLQKIDININNGKYLWPIPGYSNITSPFGYRIHPILGYKKFHAGIDIPTGRRKGINAIATGKGEIIQSVYTSGYGNKVTIDLGKDENGNNVSAVYAHLAKRYVQIGQKVSAGQAIGEVGTTGLSTGIHLHFEIRINGKPVNPLNYVSR